MAEFQMDPLQKQMLDDVFDAFTMLSPNGIVSLMHVEGGVTRYTKAGVELFGLPGEYIPNGADDWVSHVHPEDRKRYLDVMIPLANGETFSYDLNYRVRINTGEYVNFRVVGATLRNAQGKPSLIGGTMINEGLVSNTDQLTMLPNQNSFLRDLAGMLQGDKRLSAVLLSINRLSELNDTYGYGYGSRVLQQVAWTLQETLRDRARAYRMEGAKFAFLTDSISEQEAAALYDSIQLKLQRGIRVGATRHNLTISGGMVSTVGYQMDADAIRNALDYAYHESKARRHGELVNFNGKLNAEAGESLEMLGDIRSAVLNNCAGFFLEYQPVFRSGNTSKPIAAEALIRWRDEEHGVVPPLSFMPFLEQNFVFEELGSWILRQAMQDGVRFLEKNPDFILGINISPAQIEDEYFGDTLLQTLKRTGFPAGNLCLELTSGCRNIEVDRLAAAVASLREHGIRVVLDDYGSGTDSIAYMRALKPDFVKFHQSLVRDIEESEESRQALGYLTQLINVYGTKVCIKGAETEDSREILKQYPIHSVQGFVYAKPLPAGELEEQYLG